MKRQMNFRRSKSNRSWTFFTRTLVVLVGTTTFTIIDSQVIFADSVLETVENASNEQNNSANEDGSSVNHLDNVALDNSTRDDAVDVANEPKERATQHSVTIKYILQELDGTQTVDFVETLTGNPGDEYRNAAAYPDYPLVSHSEVKLSEYSALHYSINLSLSDLQGDTLSDTLYGTIGEVDKVYSLVFVKIPPVETVIRETIDVLDTDLTTPISSTNGLFLVGTDEVTTQTAPDPITGDFTTTITTRNIYHKPVETIKEQMVLVDDKGNALTDTTGYVLIDSVTDGGVRTDVQANGDYTLVVTTTKTYQKVAEIDKSDGKTKDDKNKTSTHLKKEPIHVNDEGNQSDSKAELPKLGDRDDIPNTINGVISIGLALLIFLRKRKNKGRQ